MDHTVDKKESNKTSVNRSEWQTGRVIGSITVVDRKQLVNNVDTEQYWVHTRKSGQPGQSGFGIISDRLDSGLI